MKSIIPEQSQSTIFDKLIQAAMDSFISEGEVFDKMKLYFYFVFHATLVRVDAPQIFRQFLVTHQSVGVTDIWKRSANEEMLMSIRNENLFSLKRLVESFQQEALGRPASGDESMDIKKVILIFCFSKRSPL